MMDVSILGCGWLGKPLANYLLNKGLVIKGSTTSEDKLQDFKNLGISPFIVDIDNLDEYKTAPFFNSEILVIAIPSKNINGFKSLISQIEKSSIRKVIFISSTSVYPSLNNEVTESSETLKTPLVEIENLFIENAKFKTTIIRFAGLFGYDRNPGNWFENKKIPQPNGFVNMIHQDDCIEIIYKIIEKDVFGEIFNACSNHHPTRKEYYTLAKKKLKKESPTFDDASSLKYKIINADKVQKQLKYSFIHDDLLV